MDGIAISFPICMVTSPLSFSVLTRFCPKPCPDKIILHCFLFYFNRSTTVHVPAGIYPRLSDYPTRIPNICNTQRINPNPQLEKIPYNITGPAMVNILQPMPNT